MKNSSFQKLVISIADAGRDILFKRNLNILQVKLGSDIFELCHETLKQKGEAIGIALAREVLGRYQRMNIDEKTTFFLFLRDKFEPNSNDLNNAIKEYNKSPTRENRLSLSVAAEAPRLKLIRTLNMAPGGTVILVKMRKDLLSIMPTEHSLSVVEADFKHVFNSWFNRGFLQLEKISWDTSAATLERFILYEAVHEISGWKDLKRRLQSDRRCYAFFHPALLDDPLIFVEVALTKGLSSSISDLLKEQTDDSFNPNVDADTAIFYSISNCQEGLKGISFGNFLIKQVVASLKEELPNLSCFSTLSPVPGFCKWLKQNDIAVYDDYSTVDEATKNKYLTHCAKYLALEKKKKFPVDPVARFHLGNGAGIERLNWLADASIKGIKQSCGIMVNYKYHLDSIESNHELYIRDGLVSMSKEVRALLKN